jgi:hypothetical protein
MLFDYHDLLGARRNPALGLLILPLALIAAAGGIFVFIYSTTTLLMNSWHALSVAQTAPLAYAFTAHHLSWFDLPITALSLLGITMLGATLVWMYIGKSLSQTPGRLIPNMLAYLALYWIVAPLWLIRSVADVALGVRTTWR